MITHALMHPLLASRAFCLLLFSTSSNCIQTKFTFTDMCINHLQYIKQATIKLSKAFHPKDEAPVVINTQGVRSSTHWDLTFQLDSLTHMYRLQNQTYILHSSLATLKTGCSVKCITQPLPVYRCNADDEWLSFCVDFADKLHYFIFWVLSIFCTLIGR